VWVLDFAGSERNDQGNYWMDGTLRAMRSLYPTDPISATPVATSPTWPSMSAASCQLILSRVLVTLASPQKGWSHPYRGPEVDGPRPRCHTTTMTCTHRSTFIP